MPPGKRRPVPLAANEAARFSEPSICRSLRAGKTSKSVASSEQLGVHLLQIVAGDKIAMGRLYAATSSKLFGVILRILTDRSESEDVLQDVYVAVWQSAGQYNASLGRPISWLTALARNRAIDSLRRKRWVEADGGESAMWLIDPEPCAVTQIEQKQQALHIRDCLGRLDPRTASAFRMAFYDDVTYSEIAKHLGIAEGTAKSIIRRKLVDLRTQVSR